MKRSYLLTVESVPGKDAELPSSRVMSAIVFVILVALLIYLMSDPPDHR
jgi:hypothetical protein